jgi:hypothetical protein
MPHEELIEQFIASFDKLDEMADFPEINPLVKEFAVGSPDSYGRLRWKPKKVRTDQSQLEPLSAKLPARFPPLFEELVLSYRWAEVDLQLFRLLPNPPGPDLSGLLKEMRNAPAFWENLLPAGYIQFGLGPDMNYDPVCFDIRLRTKGRDYRVVKIDHEEILCNNRVKVVAELAPSFRQLMLRTIERADLASE